MVRSLGPHTLVARFALLILTLMLAWTSSASGQVPPSLAIERSQLYEALAAEAKALEQQSNLLKKVIRVVRPTVVHLEAAKTETSTVAFSGAPAVEEAGAGVIVELQRRKFVITNRHVIHHAPLDKITIQLADGRKINPKRVWSDPGTDVAVLYVDAPGLVPARLGDSRKLEIGDFVLAMGSPFGLNHSATFGIVSAMGRRDLKLGREGVVYQDFIQTDAAINPGNSGGPLMNLRGEVIGINTAIASNSGGSEGIGFTIPINMVKVVAEQLIELGQVRRAFLGVNLDPDFTAEEAFRLGLPRKIGARVTGTRPGSAAERAKIVVDDIILEFEGVEVEDDGHLVNLVSLTPVGNAVSVVLWRNKERKEFRVQVGRRTQDPLPN